MQKAHFIAKSYSQIVSIKSNKASLKLGEVGELISFVGRKISKIPSAVDYLRSVLLFSQIVEAEILKLRGAQHVWSKPSVSGVPCPAP